jgi:glycyl-tRNA synthetase
VLEASGHVERFTDLMVKDAKNGECHRADHLLEDKLKQMQQNPLDGGVRKDIENVLARLDELTPAELSEQLKKYECKAPETGNDISEPFPFNLMFATSIGPKGDVKGYLRPETAQGIFVNFPSLLYYNGGKLPFAAAQMGQSFRNEISPQQGILRVREFTQGEIEHFVDPDHKDHPKYEKVKNLEMYLFSRDVQVSAVKKPVMTRLADALAQGIIANETLAYFLARTYLFMVKVGINPERMRFRQHLAHEMAHYAEDCWDCEVESSYGWIECVGIADRSAFDLKAHATASKKDMSAYIRFDEPIMVDELVVEPNKKVLGKAFKKDAKVVTSALDTLTEANALKLKEELEKNGEASLKAFCDGGDFTVTKDMVKIEQQRNKVSGKNIIPGVIEPSFGIGRILYCMLEHAYYVREAAENEKETRTVFRFTPLVAPLKCTVFPLLQKEPFNSTSREIANTLTDAGLSTLIDTTGASVGKRYARTDEIGVPFAVTVDHNTFEEGADLDTVTLRERDSCSQVRLPISNLTRELSDLVDMRTKWEDVQARYPAQAAAAGGGPPPVKTETNITVSLRCP